MITAVRTARRLPVPADDRWMSMRISLKTKAILLIVAIALLIGVAGMVVFDNGIQGIVTKHYENRAEEIARTMAVVLDAERVRDLRDAVLAIYNAAENRVTSEDWGSPEFEAYLALYAGIEESEDFLYLRQQLRGIQDVLDVNCLCIVCTDYENARTIYLADGAYEDDCPPGCIDPIYEENPLILQDPEIGYPAFISNTEEYGYLLAAGMPIHTGDGELVGYATVDLSMNEIVSYERQLVLVTALVFGVITILVGLAGILLVDRYLVRPINRLSEAAESYTTRDRVFSELDIHTGDEIEVLANSMVHMEQDINNYVINLVNTQNALMTAREQAELLNREANIDALTKLRNKRAYDLTITAVEEDGGSYALAMIDLNGLKETNDRYGHDKGDVAIRELAAIICRVFKHSPVFRIGGDEFIVILRNSDFEHREPLIEQFYAEIRKSRENNEEQPWKRVSAACGCAVYDPEKDRNSNDVFKRADSEMYELKKKMKSEQ